MALPMITPVTAKTINHLNPDAGILLNSFDFSSATDAYTLMALVKSAIGTDKCFGATKGGINVPEGRETWSPSYDSKRMRYKGESFFAGAAPKMSGSLVEFTPANVKAVSGAADVDRANELKIKVQPRASINLDDYFTNVVFVANNGPNGLYLVELKNALCTVGMNSQSVDKDVATMPFEFTAHSDSPEFTDELPISYYFFGVSEEATAAVANEVQGEENGETTEG